MRISTRRDDRGSRTHRGLNQEVEGRYAVQRAAKSSGGEEEGSGRLRWSRQRAAYPAVDSAAPTEVSRGPRPKSRYDRLEGVNSLNIQLQTAPNDYQRALPGPAGGEIAFHSLGVEPELVLTVVDRLRLEWLARAWPWPSDLSAWR